MCDYVFTAILLGASIGIILFGILNVLNNWPNKS